MASHNVAIPAFTPTAGCHFLAVDCPDAFTKLLCAIARKAVILDV